jgi:anaerobic selenocysteine-containing dehydrogenase
MGYEEHFPWNSDEEVAEHFFSTSGVTVKDLTDNPEGVYFGKKEYRLFERKDFRTASKKIELFSSRMEELGVSGIPTHVEPEQSHVSNPELVREYPEILLTGARQIEYIDAQMRETSLRVIIPEAEAEINSVTAKKYDILNGEMIGIETPRGIIKIRARVTDNIMKGVVSVPHGWAAANCNILLDINLKDPVSGYVTMRSVACRIVKLT